MASAALVAAPAGGRSQDPSRTVFVGGLPAEATEPVLRVFFAPFGALTSIRVRRLATAAARGPLHARPTARRCGFRPAAAPPRKPCAATALRCCFPDALAFAASQLISDPRTGRSKGYAFVTFVDEEAAAAVKARGKLDVYGRSVDVGSPQGSRPPGSVSRSGAIPADRRAFVGGLPREARAGVP